MKKLSLALVGMLFVAGSCVPSAAPTHLTVTETRLMIPTVTFPALPDITALEWASDEKGIVMPRKLYPLVGAIDKKYRRTIDLGYADLRIAVVLGEGVDLQGSGLIAKQRDIRSFYAAELNKQASLMPQLEQTRALLDSQNITKDSVVIIEGKNWSDDLSVSPSAGHISQVVEFGETSQDEIEAIYVLENGNLRQLSKGEEPNLLPRLYTDGAYIKREDIEEIVQLKGVNLAAFAADRGHQFDYAYNVGLKNLIAQKWNVNLLRVSLDSIWTDDALMEDLDKLVDFAEINGMYVLLNPHQFADSTEGDLPNETVTQLMSKLALRYKTKTNLLYGLWNEPVPSSTLGFEDYDQEWALWLERATPVAEAIRSNNSDSIIIVPGGRYWARDTSYYLTNPFEVFSNRNNIIYDIHDYPDFTNSETFSTYPEQLPDRPRNLPHSMALTRAYAQKIVDDEIAPVLIGEFGGSEPAGEFFNTDRELEYMIDILKLANRSNQRIHTAFWAVDSDDTNSYGLFNLGTDSLTNRGFLIYYDLTGEFHAETPEHLKEIFKRLSPLALPTDFLN